MTVMSWEFESPSLHIRKGNDFKNSFCGNSSVGRAQPCQGWGREFEPRFPLTSRKAVEEISSIAFFLFILHSSFFTLRSSLFTLHFFLTAISSLQNALL